MTTIIIIMCLVIILNFNVRKYLVETRNLERTISDSDLKKETPNWKYLIGQPPAACPSNVSSRCFFGFKGRQIPIDWTKIWGLVLLLLYKLYPRPMNYQYRIWKLQNCHCKWQKQKTRGEFMNYDWGKLWNPEKRHTHTNWPHKDIFDKTRKFEKKKQYISNITGYRPPQVSSN